MICGNPFLSPGAIRQGVAAPLVIVQLERPTDRKVDEPTVTYHPIRSTANRNSTRTTTVRHLIQPSRHVRR